jgi:dCMP deaminase
LIVSCGIVRVVVRRDHKGTSDGIELLKKSGVEVVEWPPNEGQQEGSAGHESSSV